jgi:hypothetical protein
MMMMKIFECIVSCFVVLVATPNKRTHDMPGHGSFAPHLCVCMVDDDLAKKSGATVMLYCISSL